MSWGSFLPLMPAARPLTDPAVFCNNQLLLSRTISIIRGGEKMKKIGLAIGLAVALCFVISSAYAANPDAILGKWWNQEKESQIEIYKADGKYFGKIVYLKEPAYPANDPEGMGGQTKIDRKNPDVNKRNVPLIGLLMLWDFSNTGDNLWENGFIYDPRDGKTYKCKMTLESPDILNVRGFIGVSLFGRTNAWTRVR
jgi:uncharacterized protein (DUF2147 family)